MRPRQIENENALSGLGTDRTYRWLHFIAVFFCFSTSIFSVHSQSIQWGEPWKTYKNSVYHEFLGSDESNAYLLFSENKLFKGTHYHVDVIDLQSLTHKSEYIIQEPELPEARVQMEEITAWKNYLLVAFQAIEPAGTMQWYIAFYHISDGRFIKYVRYTNSAESFETPQSIFFKTGTALYTVLSGRVEGTPGLTVIMEQTDTLLNQVSYHRFSMPVQKDRQQIDQVVVDKYDNLIFLSHNLPELEKGRLVQNVDNKNKKLWSLFFYHPRSNELFEKEITLGTKWLNALTLQLGRDGNPMVAGFFAESMEQRISGVFYLKAKSTTARLVTSKMKSLTVEQVLTSSNINSRKKEKELASFLFDRIIFTPDEGFTLVAEKYYTLINSYLDIRTNSITYTNNYYYNEILAVHVDSTGEIVYATMIPKRQFSSNDQGTYSSYAIYQDRECNLHFIFNDHPDNRDDKKDVKYMTRPSSADIAYARISKDGALEIQTIGSNSREPTIFTPMLHLPVESSDLLLFGKFGRKIRSGRFEVNNK
jgi:hypothetical protein